jgi:hypothetical protein
MAKYCYFAILPFCYLLLLSRQDSNLDQENQNLWCCHYTTGQT